MNIGFISDEFESRDVIDLKEDDFTFDCSASILSQCIDADCIILRIGDFSIKVIDCGSNKFKIIV